MLALNRLLGMEPIGMALDEDIARGRLLNYPDGALLRMADSGMLLHLGGKTHVCIGSFPTRIRLPVGLSRDLRGL